jgi:hypothetical protein
LFGGSSIERTITNSCSAATNDPNLLLFCDGSQNSIPWQTSFKLAGTYPLPLYGITLSGALQALAGISLGTAPLQYGVFTAGTGFTQPNGIGTNYFVARATVYPANCTGAACRPGGVVIPGLQSASVTIPLIAPGTEFTPRINQLDFGLSRTFLFNKTKITPKLDLFNALNADYWSAVASTQWAAQAYLQPSVVLQGRIIRVGVDVKW